MFGYVDMGDRLNETDVASKVLVFMVVGLQGYWKAPIAYYLRKSLTPETQKTLFEHALEELHHRGIKVVCVCDNGWTQLKRSKEHAHIKIRVANTCIVKRMRAFNICPQQYSLAFQQMYCSSLTLLM